MGLGANARRLNLQSATTKREEVRSELNCSLEDMLMTDMVVEVGGVCEGETVGES